MAPFALDAVTPSCPRVLFLNSGILGHRAVAALMRQLTARHPLFAADHINLSEGLTTTDRVIRRILSLRLAPASGPAANLDLRRWRQELNVGWLAKRRIRAAERQPGARSFDVLHFHPQATAYASLARMQRTPAIVSIDATARVAIEEAGPGSARVGYRASIAHDGAVFRRAKAIVSTSRWAAHDLDTLYPDCAGKVQVMPYPIDLSRFDSTWGDERSARAAASPGRPVHVLFVGGDFPRKGGIDLLNAWRDGGLAADAVLDLVTDWPLRADDLPPGVTLVRGIAPYTAPWFDVWRRADLFVMPTRHEAFGMVYQEAAAAGIPSIGSDLHAIPEIVQAGRTGLLVRPGDQAGLVRALRTLVHSADLRRAMGAAARCRMAEIADPSAYASTLGDLVLSLVTTHAHKPS